MRNTEPRANTSSLTVQDALDAWIMSHCLECHERVPDHTYLTSNELCEVCAGTGLRFPTGRMTVEQYVLA